MTHHERFRSRHPLCTCPERGGFPGGIERQDDCPGGTIAHPPPLTIAEIREIAAQYGRVAPR